MENTIPHILIVDDDANLLETMSDILTLKGFDPIKAQTGGMALALLEKHHFELALIDLRLGDMSGLKVLSAIKARSPETECILLTGHASQNTAIEAVQMGIYGFFQKPFDMEQVLLSVQRALEKKQAAQALQKSEASLQAVLQSTADGILAVGNENEVLYANERFVEIWRVSQAAMDSRNDSVLLQEILDQLSDPQSFLKKIQELYKSKEESFDTLYFKDGRVFERQSRPLMHGTELRGRVWSFRDITGRKQAEEELRVSKLIIEGIINTIPVRVFWKDKNLVYLGCNSTFASDAGFTDPKEIIGKDDYQMGWHDQAESYRSDDRQVIESGSSKLDIEESQTTPEGKIITLLTSKKPLRNFEGEISGVLGVYMDISERKLAEEELKESHDLLANLTRLVPGVVYQYRLYPDGRSAFPYSSPGMNDIYEVTPEEVREDATPVFGRLHPDDYDRVSDAIQESARTLQTFYCEYRVILPRQGLRWRWSQAHPERTEDGGTLWHGIISDITERKQTERALRESEQKYRVLFDEMLSGVAVHEIICDPQGKPIDYRFIAINTAFEKMTGLVSAVVVGRTVLEVMPATESLWIERYGQVALTRIPIQFENYSSELGKYFEVRAFSPEKGKFATIFNDITEHKLAEQANHLILETQGQLLHLDNLADIYQLVGEKIQELVGDGYVGISMLDEQIQAMEIIGLYGFGGLLEKMIHMFKVDPTKFVYLLKDMTDDELRLYRSGKLEKVEGGLYTILARKIPKSICNQVERQLEITGMYTMGFIGQNIHYGGLTLFAKRDIAPHKDMIETIMNQAAISIQRILAEDNIRQHAKELELLYESGLMFSQLLNPREIAQKIIELLGEKLDWHHTAIRLIRAQDELELVAFDQPGLRDKAMGQAAGIYFKNLITHVGEGLSGWALQQSKTLRLGEVGSDPHYVASYPGIHSGLYVPLKSGARMVGVISLESEKTNAFSEADEQLISTLASQAANAFENSRLYEEANRHAQELERRVQERTADLSLVNADLAHAMRVKDDFLASMSHELRTPLTGILGLSEVLQLKVYGELNDKQRSTLKTIEESGHHLLDLINDILDLSKIEAGKFELQFAPCSLADICQASLQLTKGMAQHKNQQVHYTPLPEPIVVRVDARRLKQMLVNLLSNAIKFTPTNGELGLEVEADESERKFRLTVWDKGIGIKPEDLDNIFKPFVQLDSGLAREYSGTGLGLSLVQHLTELHNGGIEVESKIGEGSRFTIVLPWSLQDAAPIFHARQHVTGPLILRRGAESPLVMIVDDNEMVLQMVADFLEAKQYRVMKVRSGAELLERATESHPDIMLVDIQMPGIGGLETIRRIRSHTDPRIAAAPVIAVTALAMPADRERCLRAGANDYMSKPLKLKELAVAIQKLLERKP